MARVYICQLYFWLKHFSREPLVVTVFLDNVSFFWKARIQNGLHRSSYSCKALLAIGLPRARPTIQQQVFDTVLWAEQGKSGNQYWQDMHRKPFMPANQLFSINCPRYCKAFFHILPSAVLGEGIIIPLWQNEPAPVTQWAFFRNLHPSVITPLANRSST